MKKVFLIVFLIVSGFIYGQVGISVANITTENFGTDVNSAYSNNLPAFWKIDDNYNLSNVRTVGSYFGDNVSTNVSYIVSGNKFPSIGQYSYTDYFKTTNNDKALGGLLFQLNKSINIYTQLKNTGASSIKSLNVQYNVEKYRQGTYTGGYSIIMYHSTDGINWIQSGGSFVTNFAADNSIGYPLFGGYEIGPGVTRGINNNINVEIAPGELFYLAWNYTPTSGEGSTTPLYVQALAIDDIKITPAGLPVVTTTSITDITINDAKCDGSIPSNGVVPQATYGSIDYVLEKGICWSTDPNPSVDDENDHKVTYTVLTYHIVGTLTDLDPSQTYYVRAYATNQFGTSYGEQKILKIAPTANLGTAVNNNSFTASWNELTGAASYLLDVATSNNFETDCIEGYTNLSVSLTAKEISGLTAGQTYYYRVRAVDANEKISFYSDTIRVTTLGSNGNNGIVGNTGNQNITIGNGTGIGEIQFGNITQTGNILVNHYNNPPANYGTSLPAEVSNYRWVIEPNNNLVINEETGYKLRFEVENCPDITEYANEATTTIKLYKRSNPGSGDFSDCGFLVYYNNGTVGNKDDDYLFSQLITTGFSEFVFGSESAFPVELSSFSAVKSDNKVILNWATATELNNNGFEIERNVNNNWEKIGYISGFGNSNSIKEYSFTDNNLTIAGKYLYRLKQIDNDGKFTYSNIIEVNIEAPKEFELVQNYPNPFNPETTINYSIPQNGNVKLVVFNTLGEKIATLVNGFTEAGTHSVKFNAGNLPSGIYFYQINTGNFSDVKKMILTK